MKGSSDIFEVYAVRYGHGGRNRPGNFLGGDSHDVPMPLDYYIWVATNGSLTVVIDTGFTANLAKARNRQLLLPVSMAVRRLGINPDSVEHVILTHLHYDHAGDQAAFPRACFHLQDREMAYATGRCMCHEILRQPFELDNITNILSKVYAGRVMFHDGDTELFPGISVHRIGGHSKGLQVVRIQTQRGHLVIASDAVHFYEHIETNRPFVVVHNVEDMLEGYRRVRSLASSPDHVVPGHDPLVMRRYPKAGPGLEGIAAALHVQPDGRGY
nr:N-acyl homoserine lactonase family protein [Halomonas socia]